MARVQSVPNLIQGVSQQGAQQRRDSQCEAQFDCFNSPLRGAAARPPVEFVKLWPGRVLTDAFFHEIVRGPENYITGVRAGTPFAIDLADGTDCAVAGGNVDGYLTAASAQGSLRAQTIEDTTFLLNRSVRPQMQETRSAAARAEAIVFVRSPAFSTTYSVVVSGAGGTLFASYSTPAADSDSATSATTLNIAAQLASQITGLSGYVVNQNGSMLLIYRPDGIDFGVTTVDGNGDDFMYAFKGEVSAYSRLPRKGFATNLLKVRGESRNTSDDYYVRFVGEPSTGSWVETVGPGVKLFLDPATMPHLLTLTGYRTFSYGQAGWSSRVAGNDETAKQPSFVGKVVKDVFHHQGRLALLHESGCVWSKSRFPYTFFPDTVQTVLATAPVDFTLAASSITKGAALLDYAVQIDEALYLWAPRAQFRVTSGNDPFKQDTVEAPPSTAYEYAPGCDPLAVGTLLYTATEAGAFATLRSLQFSQGRPLGDIDVTAHVSNYIPAGMRGLVASDTLRCIFAYTSGAPDRLFLYNYLLEDRSYVQSAWNSWRIPGGTILWAGLQDNRLSILQQRPEGLALLRVNLTERLVDPIAGATYRTRLDHLVSEGGVTLSYDAGSDRTTLGLPYAPTGPDLRVVTREDKAGGFRRGREFKVLSVAGQTAIVAGDLRGYKFYVGQRIAAARKESRFYVRSDKGVVPADRLTIDRFRLEVSDTGYTRIEVQPGRGAATVEEFSGRVLGTPTGQAGPPMLSNHALNARVGQLAENVAITLVNDSFMDSCWQSAAYEYSLVGGSGDQ